LILRGFLIMGRQKGISEIFTVRLPGHVRVVQNKDSAIFFMCFLEYGKIFHFSLHVIRIWKDFPFFFTYYPFDSIESTNPVSK